MLDGHATRRKHQEANHCSALRLKIAWRVEAKQHKKKERQKKSPATARAVRPGRCWLRALFVHCAASTALTTCTGYA
jgi:hypothetical protein